MVISNKSRFAPDFFWGGPVSPVSPQDLRPQENISVNKSAISKPSTVFVVFQKGFQILKGMFSIKDIFRERCKIKCIYRLMKCLNSNI